MRRRRFLVLTGAELEAIAVVLEAVAEVTPGSGVTVLTIEGAAGRVLLGVREASAPVLAELVPLVRDECDAAGIPPGSFVRLGTVTPAAPAEG